RHTRSKRDWSSDVCSSDLFVQVRLRNLVTGNTFDTRLAATDFVDEAPLETKEFQVLYRDQGGVHVMDTNTYEQYTLDNEAVGDRSEERRVGKGRSWRWGGE